MNNSPLIILGMHRSGTSLISHWLKCCGLNLGNELLQGSIGNVDGHFEDVDFLNWHESVFNDNQLPASGFFEEQDFIISPERQLQFKTILQRKQQNHMWGWKEPRSCLFVNFYQAEIPNANYLIIIRHYSDVISSLIKRDLKMIENDYLSKQKPLQKLKWNLYKKRKKLEAYNIENMLNFYSRVYIHYNLRLLILLEQQNTKNKVIPVNYINLLKDDQYYLKEINKKFSLNLKYISFSTIYKDEQISKECYFNPQKLSSKNIHDLEDIYLRIKHYVK